jgi:thiol-disulfide isomerase/thioredoxin
MTIRFGLAAWVAVALGVAPMSTLARQQEEPQDDVSFGAGAALTRAQVALEHRMAPAGERGYFSTAPLPLEIAPQPDFQVQGLPVIRSQHPLFGSLRLGRGGKVAFLLDQSAPTRRAHDLLYLDRNQDYDLSNDGEPVQGASVERSERGSHYLEFTALPFEVYYGESRRDPYAITIYGFYGRVDSAPALYATAASWRQGRCVLDGVEADVYLFDEDADGIYAAGSVRWALVDTAEAGTNGSSPPLPPLVRGAAPQRLRGLPYRLASISPGGIQVEIVAETEANAKKADLASDARLVEPPRSRAAAPIAFETSLDAAFTRARDENKTVLLIFSAPWSKACRDLEERTLADAEVARLITDRFVGVKIDPGHDELAVKRYEVAALPTILFVDRHGAVVERALGYRQATSLAERLRRWRN